MFRWLRLLISVLALLAIVAGGSGGATAAQTQHRFGAATCGHVDAGLASTDRVDAKESAGSSSGQRDHKEDRCGLGGIDGLPWRHSSR